MKKKILILIPAFFFLLLVIGFGILRLESVRTYLLKHSKSYERDVACFTIMPYKCGPMINGTDEDIISQIRLLKITKEEARELILSAQANPSDYEKQLKSKGVLTEDEKEILKLKKGLPAYYERVLKVIDKMNIK